jgi:sugar phosphate isomerase/epimerase
LASEIEIKQWIQKYSHNLAHMHLHNNFKDDDSHSSILKGTLNFEEIITAIIELENYPDFVFEIFSTEELYESIEFFDKFMENKKCLIN